MRIAVLALSAMFVALGLGGGVATVDPVFGDQSNNKPEERMQGAQKTSGPKDGNVQTLKLEKLDCEGLLERFGNTDEREAGGNGQYSGGSASADADLRDRIEFCLEREIINVPNDDLPDTGGLPLVGLAILALASVIAGASVVRGVGRRE